MNENIRLSMIEIIDDITSSIEKKTGESNMFIEFTKAKNILVNKNIDYQEKIKKNLSSGFRLIYENGLSDDYIDFNSDLLFNYLDKL